MPQGPIVGTEGGWVNGARGHLHPEHFLSSRGGPVLGWAKKNLSRQQPALRGIGETLHKPAKILTKSHGLQTVLHSMEALRKGALRKALTLI